MMNIQQVIQEKHGVQFFAGNCKVCRARMDPKNVTCKISKGLLNNHWGLRGPRATWTLCEE